MPYSNSSRDTMQQAQDEMINLTSLTTQSHLETPEQIRRFELLRLAFFTLKLRKLEQRASTSEDSNVTEEYTLRSSLLRHAIFQQVVTLTKLDAREQALQLIEACRR